MSPVKSRLPNPFGLFDLLSFPEAVLGNTPFISGSNAVFLQPNANPRTIGSLDFSFSSAQMFGALPIPVRSGLVWQSEFDDKLPLPVPGGVSTRLVRTSTQYHVDCGVLCKSAFPSEPRFWITQLPFVSPESYCVLPKLGWSLCCSDRFLTTVDILRGFEQDGNGSDYPVHIDLSKVQCDGDRVLDPDPFGLLDGNGKGEAP